MTDTMTADIIICTKDRPEDIRRVIDSIKLQTRKPQSVIVIDASGTSETQKIIESAATLRARRAQTGIQFIYRKSPVASTTHQRNMGIALAKNAITFFLDDDVILAPTYIEKMLEAYEKYPDAAGVSGNITNFQAPSFLHNLFKHVFLHTGTTKKRNGYYWPSGFYIVNIGRDKMTDETFMPSGACSYRREILNDFTFDERLGTYAYMEDMDISFRISRKHRLLRTPEAKLRHLPSPHGRIDNKEMKAKVIFNHAYLFRKNFPQSPLNIAAHAWSHLGLIIEAVGASIVKKDVSYVTGLIEGYRQIFR